MDGARPLKKSKEFRLHASGPRQWNLLPPELRDAILSLPTFKSFLKVHIFSKMFDCGIHVCL